MSILDRGAEILRASGIENPRSEARLLLAHALGIRVEDVIAERYAPDAAALERYERLLVRRAAHEPMAYILNRREFWSLDFALGPGVLIPRPETETLVEQALKAFPRKDADLDVLDLGTGSGCLLLAFLSERPNAKGLGIDRSREALAWAAHNARRLGLADRVQFLQADWADAPAMTFDVVFSNPPYIETRAIATLEPDVAAYEPLGALDGGADGLDAYRSLAALQLRLLRPDGRAFIEIGLGQDELVTGIFSAAGLHVEQIVKDLAGVPRCVCVAASAREQQVK